MVYSQDIFITSDKTVGGLIHISDTLTNHSYMKYERMQQIWAQHDTGWDQKSGFDAVICIWLNILRRIQEFDIEITDIDAPKLSWCCSNNGIPIYLVNLYSHLWFDVVNPVTTLSVNSSNVQVLHLGDFFKFHIECYHFIRTLFITRNIPGILP